MLEWLRVSPTPIPKGYAPNIKLLSFSYSPAISLKAYLRMTSLNHSVATTSTYIVRIVEDYLLNLSTGTKSLGWSPNKQRGKTKRKHQPTPIKVGLRM